MCSEVCRKCWAVVAEYDYCQCPDLFSDNDDFHLCDKCKEKDKE